MAAGRLVTMLTQYTQNICAITWLGILLARIGDQRTRIHFSEKKILLISDAIYDFFIWATKSYWLHVWIDHYLSNLNAIPDSL